MTKTKVLTNFGHYSDAELEQKAELIAYSMKDNANFPNPNVSIESLEQATTEFSGAITKAKEGGKVDKEAKHTKRKALIEMLNNLALYVQMQGNGNSEVLASSGYSLSKAREHIGVLPKPENFSVKPETPGMVKLKLKAIKGANSYRYEYKLVEEEKWTAKVHTKSTLELDGLISGKKYQFRVAGVGTEEKRVYSDIISSFVL